jgi:hypothetical protein
MAVTVGRQGRPTYQLCYVRDQADNARRAQILAGRDGNTAHEPTPIRDCGDTLLRLPCAHRGFSL